MSQLDNRLRSEGSQNIKLGNTKSARHKLNKLSK